MADIKFNLILREDLFELDKPLAEPETNWTHDWYRAERVVKKDETIIWFGINKNWVKEPLKDWVDNNQQPCEEPIYEKLYREKYDKSQKNTIKEEKL